MPKVIFTQTVPGVAVKGEVKNVRPGFLRNFLFPRNKAVHATPRLLAQWEQQRKKMLIEKEQLRSQLEELKRRLSGSRITIAKKITKTGTLYGGVKPGDVAASLLDQVKIEIPEEAVTLQSPIKAVGKYDITINLGEGITTQLPIEIVEKK